mmetsp:Transcript_7905/g.7952  ORF Transcript_7905/g.7952 Transcript_7905/m.7952 type:complete len:354 (+) Transcript_7905:98-1159(+)
MIKIALFLVILLESCSSFRHAFTRSTYRRDTTCMSSILSENWESSLKSPCKLNLFLRILGKRDTGFHELASLFQCISLSDYMYFSKLPEDAVRDEMTCSDSSLAVDDSNLVIKALSLMRNKTGKKQYFKVFLDKKVPIQAGLGGGSGNAATAMHAFNTLCGFPGTLEELRTWSGDIGSDITFFFSTGTAYCTGRGEIVQSLSALPLPQGKQIKVHVFKPKDGLSTALVFKALNIEACKGGIDPAGLLEGFEVNGALNSAKNGLLINDLEAPAFVCNPALLSLKNEISAQMGAIGAAGAMMSGSGTSIYALMPSNQGDSISTSKAVQAVLSAFPTVQHFECEFMNKKDDVNSWY